MMVIFHGTNVEKRHLENALNRNCTCEFDSDSHERLAMCAGHAALVADQRFVDGLLFDLRLRETFLKEEGISEP